MKSRIVLTVLALGLVVVFAACSADPVPPTPVPQADLLSLKVGTLEITRIPEPVSGKDWNNEDYIVGGADTGRIVVIQEGDTENIAIEAEVSPGARASWGIGWAGNRPDNFYNPNVKADFTLEEYLYLKVTADDGVTSNYYRFGSSLASAESMLVNVTISGRDPYSFGNPDEFEITDIENLPIEASRLGKVAITMREAMGAVIVGEPKNNTATLKYAMAVNADSKPGEFKDANVFDFDATGSRANVLYVEVTSQNGLHKNYYGFTVEAGRMASIAKLELDSNEVVSIGTGNTQAQFINVAPGSYASADQQIGGFEVKIQLDDEDGSFEYARANSTSAALTTISGWTTTDKLSFTNNQVLVIKVSSARKNAADDRYYKVIINLLAANFRKHPQSAAYYYYNADTKIGPSNDEVPVPAFDWYANVGLTGVQANNPAFNNTVRPLTFELDRPDTGFTYQWYEANSWYGGYGFDADGRVSWLDQGGTQHWEVGFTDDDYHRLNFDEKNNVSLHNGGNQFYRLPTKGRAIPGATQKTYTPPINRRPFIAGFTHESHYYWVVVTGNGLTATSSRATIVSERDPAKKHHIVDLHAYMTEGAIGLQDTPRNIDAFTFKRQKRTIPVTFPADFNIMDYSVAVVQATFFLKDGTPWIQNWTQGDIGFEKDGEGLVLFYNLTNNNATLGLDGDSKEPQGANLVDTPTDIVVKPAGEKPPKEMPPLNADGTPKNTGDAQGWFTPYIELVEVRFFGPPRIR